MNSPLRTHALFEKKLPWPHLLAFLDAALAADKGIAVRSYAGLPLTVSQAETMRQAIGKLRKSLRDRAGDTLVPYDALTISCLPDLSNVQLEIRFHGPTPPQEPSLLLDARAQLPSEYAQPSSCCSIRAILPSGAVLQVGSPEEPCPTFSIGWKAIRAHLPAILQITNTYSLQDGNDYDLL